MSGVIDDNGVQWEHCGACDAWVRIEELLYEVPRGDLPFGRDLCSTCSIIQQGLGHTVVMGTPSVVEFINTNY